MSSVLVLMILGWYFLLYSPLTAEREKLTEEMGNLQDSVNADTRYQAQTAGLKVRIIQLAERTNEWDARFPKRKHIVSLAKNIIQYFNQNGLELVSIEPSLFELYALERAGAQVAGQFIMQLPLKFTLRGRFVDLGHSLEQMHTLPFNMTISEIDIDSPSDIYPRVEGRLNMFLYVHI